MNDRQQENALRIAAYLQNRLTPEEREAFKRAMSDDDELRVQYVNALMNRADGGSTGSVASSAGGEVMHEDAGGGEAVGGRGLHEETVSEGAIGGGVVHEGADGGEVIHEGTAKGEVMHDEVLDEEVVQEIRDEGPAGTTYVVGGD